MSRLLYVTSSKRATRFLPTAFVTTMVILAAACRPSEESRRAEEQKRLAKIEKHEQERKAAGIDTQPQVQYKIVKEDNLLNIKRQLWILLPHAVSGDELPPIATELKRRETKTYERTFMVYHLPGMDMDGLAWATTHFDPQVEVKILGLTPEEERRLSVVEPADGEVIGSWLQELELGEQLTILRRGKQFFLRRVFKDGSSGEEGLVEKRSSQGRRFEYTPDRGHGEYFLVSKTGELEEWDPDGMVFRARRLR